MQFLKKGKAFVYDIKSKISIIVWEERVERGVEEWGDTV